jgi:hypothetical protein
MTDAPLGVAGFSFTFSCPGLSGEQLLRGQVC